MLGSPMSFFSYSPFSGWIPIWSIEARRVYLFAWASKTQARGSPRWGTLRYSRGHLRPTETVQAPCLGTLLVFHVNQVIQHLFSTKFPTTLFFPNLSFIFLNKFFLAYSVSPSNFPGSSGEGPWHLTILEAVQSWEIGGENMNSERLYLMGLQNHCRWWLHPWN